MKIKYILIGLLFFFSKNYSQIAPLLPPCGGSSDCERYWRDSDGDGFGVLPSGWYIQGYEPTDYILYNINKLDCDDNDAQITLIKWYKDFDGDGYGNPNNFIETCINPGNLYVTNNFDCDDNNVTLNPSTTWYLDYDHDSFGSSTILAIQCLQPINGVQNNLDCNDNLAIIKTNTIWYSDSDNDGFGDSSTILHSCSQPLGYVNNNADNCPSITGSVFGCIVPTSNGNSSTYDQNYIITLIPKIAVSNLTSITDTKDININISYFDGLGRPIQNVAYAQSNSGKDIVTPIEYDALGRQTKDYLPYATTTTNTLYKQTALADVSSFYNTATYGSTLNPYSEKLFEASPLNRVMKQAAPGTDWAMGLGHEIKLDYQTNTATEVKLFKATASWSPTEGLYTISLTQTTDYSANELYKTITYDENSVSPLIEANGSTVEFKNKEGQVVLKRTYSTVGIGNANIAHDTYYVYDQYGNLTYVIPPLVDTNATITTTVLEGLCYQYKYDYRNRLVEKKLPGKQWEFIVYDKLDRPVMTGPAFSPFKEDPNIGWLITKYDAFSRPVYTGWYSGYQANSANRKILQDLKNATTDVLNESRTASSTIDNIAIAYTNNAIPVSGYYLLTINYYDTYGFPNAAPVPTTVETQAVLANVKTLPIGSWVRALTTNGQFSGETTTIFYDQIKARPIRTYVANYLGGFTQVDTKLDFIGKTIYSINNHKRDAGSALLTFREDFTYSDQDRLLTHTHQITSPVILPVQLLADNSYNELGQLLSKKVGNSSAFPLQKVDYTYNIRGWLTGINNVGGDPALAPNPLQKNSDPFDLFAFKINYNTVKNEVDYTGTALYNGNISETYWRTSSDNQLRKYGYSYDNLNRLRTAVYQRPGATLPVTNMYDESMSYDKNGNIMTLQRKGDYDAQTVPIPIDDLTYGYDTTSNQLLWVKENSNNNGTLGFKDLTTYADNNTNAVPDYGYDANGNMTKDLNKGINPLGSNPIKYNHLNLPTEIYFSATKKINYIYSATGEKLQKIITSGTVVSTVDYLGGFQYLKAKAAAAVVMQFFPTAEGYVNVDLGVYKYVFNYTDHLGNVRLSYTKNEVTGLTVIMEENHYYPFGLKHTNYNTTVMKLRGSAAQVSLTNPYKYKYNGKELQDELGLGMYDYGARNYDPALGRWMNIDALAELADDMSTYHYANNNPVIYIDPDGLSAESSNRFETIYKDTKGNVILDTDDGSDDIVVVPDAKLKDFKELVKYTDPSLYNSQEWNDHFKSEFLNFKNPDEMNSLLDRFTTQWSRQNAIDYLQNPTAANAMAMSYSEALSQWTDPQQILAAASVLAFRPRANGIIYLREDLTGNLKPYAGQAKNEARYLARQAEHARAHPDSHFKFKVIDNGSAKGKFPTSLDIKEQKALNKLGGPTNKSNPSGGAANKKNVIKQ